MFVRILHYIAYKNCSQTSRDTSNRLKILCKSRMLFLSRKTVEEFVFVIINDECYYILFSSPYGLSSKTSFGKVRLFLFFCFRGALYSKTIKTQKL